MMFGTRDEFDYLECGRCGTVQIVEVPDLSKYYPKDYYSLASAGAVAELTSSIQRRFAVREIGRYFVEGRGAIGRWAAGKRPWLAGHFPASLREPLLGLNFRSRILDFGCGAGELLRILHLFGFRALTGADAFIDGEIHHPEGITIHKLPLEQLEPAFDLIMLHHSFEHLPEPRKALTEIRRLLAAGGTCLIRIPVVNLAWAEYGTDWVQLDPPRHLFLYTERAFRSLAEECGFTVAKVTYDSEAFQFWGSEQYRRSIAMNDPQAYSGDISASIFTAEQIAEWERKAEELNAEGRGDQACFYLKAVSP